MSTRPNAPQNALDRHEGGSLMPTGEPQASSSGGFGSGPDLEAASAPARTKFPQQLVVFMIVLTVSAATIFTMRQHGMQAGIAQAEEIKLDVGRDDAEKARTYERIMADLRRIESPLDVALTEFKQSPFMPKGADTTVVLDDRVLVGPSAEEQAERIKHEQEELRRQVIQSALAEVKINMVLGDMARINKEYYRVGDQVGEYFTIVKIDGRSVTVQADGVNYVLVMDEKVDSSSKGPSKFTKPRN